MAMTGEAASTALLDICGLAPVVPVLVIEDPASITGLGTALVAGGLPVCYMRIQKLWLGRGCRPTRGNRN